MSTIQYFFNLGMLLRFVCLGVALGFTLELTSGKAQATTHNTLDGTQWQLIQMDGFHGNLPEIPMTFDSKRIFGTDGCNRISIPYTEKAEGTDQGKIQLKLGVGISTKRACISAAEIASQVWRQNMLAVTTYRIESQILLLLDSQQKEHMRFVRQSKDLEGTRYQMQGYNNGKQALVSDEFSAQIQIEFLSQGVLEVLGGCAKLLGRYEYDAALNKFRAQMDAATSKTPCPHKTSRAKQQAQNQMLLALARARTVQIEALHLTLRDDAGSMQITAKRIKR